MQQLDLDFSPPPAAGRKPLVDLSHFQRLARAAEAVSQGARPEELRAACLQLGLAKSGWRFLARHGRPAYVAVEEYSDNPEQRFVQVVFYLNLQARAGLERPADLELGQRFMAAVGHITEMEFAAAPRLLAAGARHLGEIGDGEQRRAFLSNDWVRMLNWFRDQEPGIDRNQWKAGWPALQRVYLAWQKLNPAPAEWPSLLAPFQAGASRVQPLNSAQALALEGHEMRHCVAIYSTRCRREAYRLFSVQRAGCAAARATVGIYKHERGWDVDQVKGFANATPDPEAFRVAALIANRYEMAERREAERREAEARQKAAAEQRTLEQNRAAHRAALAEYTELPPAVQAYFSAEEVEYLAWHLSWMQKLAAGDLQPTSIDQVRFVAVVRGICTPQREHEWLWVRYLEARAEVGPKLEANPA